MVRLLLLREISSPSLSFLRITLKKESIKQIPYASAVGRSFYTQLYTRTDIAYVVSSLGRFQSDPWLEHCKGVKKVMRYL